MTDIEVAEKLFVAKYITENITKTERILNSAVFDSVHYDSAISHLIRARFLSCA